MICLFDSNANNFDSYFLPIYPLNCTVHGEVNGDLSLVLTISNDDNRIKLGQIVTVPLPSYNSNQAFRIYEAESSLNSKNIRYKGKHIFYDLEDNFIIDKRPTGATPQQALQRFLEGLSYSTPFSIGEVFTGSTNTAYWEYKNPVDALIGTDENSFINRWGGELKRNNFKINFVTRLSQQTEEQGLRVFVGKEVLDMNIITSVENTVTRIIPTGLNSDNSIVKLPEIYVDSPHISDYAQPKIKRIHYSWLKLGEGGRSTLEQIYVELRRCAQAEFAKGIDLPQIRGQISLIELAKTVEYEEYADLLNIQPYDDFVVVDSDGNEYSARLTAFDYDCLAEKYINLKIGNVNAAANFNKLVKIIAK